MEHTTKNYAGSAWTVFVLSLLQVAITLLPFLGIGRTVEATTAGSVIPFEPLQFTFSIWTIIYLGCVMYGLHQLADENIDKQPFVELRPHTISLFLSLIVRALVAQYLGSGWTFPVMIRSFFSARQTYDVLNRHQKFFTSNLITHITTFASLSLLAGWITVALFANTSEYIGFINSLGISTLTWSWILLIGVILVAAWMLTTYRPNGWYAAAVIWGLLGVMLANLNRDYNIQMAIVAGLGILLVFGLNERKQIAETVQEITH